MRRTSQNSSWQHLEGKVSLEVFTAPKTAARCGDKQDWPPVSGRVVKYLAANVVGGLWTDHLALIALVLTARRRDPATVLGIVCNLHVRFRAIFAELQLSSMQEWDAKKYIPAYLKGELVVKDSDLTRTIFWQNYSSASYHVNHWLASLPDTEQHTYQSYILPPLNVEVVRGLTKIGELEKLQRARRKAETDAVLPHFADIRAQAHLRSNRIERLRAVYHEMVAFVEKTETMLPFSFSYEEGADAEQGIGAQERYHLRLWDRRSFVLAHQEHYSRSTVQYAKHRKEAFREEREHTFLEFVRVERLRDDAPAEGLWFEELLRQDVLGENDNGSPKEISARMQWLHSWGYGLEDIDATTRPFATSIAGLLQWPRNNGASTFLTEAQSRTTGVLFVIEPLYVAALFGLLALEVFTTTGMRINEAMQIRLTKDCLVRLTMPAPPEAADQTPRLRYALRLLPKGERTETLYDYFIGTETLRVFARVGHMLEKRDEHEVGESLPVVAYSPRHARSHRFAPAPYLFQYNGKHLAGADITACMRFLLHGMLFRTKEGQIVVLKAHLLRHAFATHAVQVERIPLDIVGMWLKQKNLEVTAYYSEPTASMVGEAADLYVARIASHIHVGKAVMRSPEEYQQMYEQAIGRAGTFASVIGGDCVMHGYCPAKFACVGCPGKVPDPAKRSQVERHKQWAQQQVIYALQEGLLPEAERMKQLVRECEQELRQMDHIERYRRDEKQIPVIRREGSTPFRSSPSMVRGEGLHQEARTHSDAGEAERGSVAQGGKPYLSSSDCIKIEGD